MINIKKYEKEMIIYINSLSPNKLKYAIIAAGAKKVSNKTNNPKNKMHL